jgi:serine/threonine protein kinase
MSIRGFLRGEIPGELVQSVAREAALKYGQEVESLELLETDNWLSTPCVVNDSLFLKIITSQNSFVHGLLTTGRNIGMFSSGTEGFFEHFRTPIEMAEHELWATRRMRELGVNAPEPLEAFEHDGVGVLVLEYLPSFETLDTVDRDQVEAVAPELFEFLARMHETGLVHGDLRSENVLLADGHIYFIDATNVRGDAIDDARAYDIACALGALEPLIGARSAVALADEYHTKAQLLDADRFLNFVNIRPDHGFDAQEVRGEITKLTS